MPNRFSSFFRFPVMSSLLQIKTGHRITRWLPKIYGGDFWFIMQRQTVFIKQIIIEAGDEKSINTGCHSGLMVSVHLNHDLITVGRLVSRLLSISQTPPPHARTCLLHFYTSGRIESLLCVQFYFCKKLNIFHS